MMLAEVLLYLAFSGKSLLLFHPELQEISRMTGKLLHKTLPILLAGDKAREEQHHQKHGFYTPGIYHFGWLKWLDKCRKIVGPKVCPKSSISIKILSR